MFITNFKRNDKTIIKAIYEYHNRGYVGIFGSKNNDYVHDYMHLHGNEDVDVNIFFKILNEIRTKKFTRIRMKREPFLTVQDMKI
jgi:hypothetical protein